MIIAITAIVSLTTTMLLCHRLRQISDATEAATEAAAMRRIQARGNDER
jgi:hypothetical protein